MSEGHGWVGGKFYASLADVPCSGRDAEWVRMAVASHKLPQCPCRKTCPEVVAA